MLEHPVFFSLLRAKNTEGAGADKRKDKASNRFIFDEEKISLIGEDAS